MSRLRSGHAIAREVADFVESSFPSYVRFDEQHLCDLESHGHWRGDTHPSLEVIGVSCFGLLKSLNFINRNYPKLRVPDPDQVFKGIYFHFGLLFETLGFLLHHLRVVQCEVGIREALAVSEMSRDQLMRDYEQWIHEHYSPSFKRFVREGAPIAYNPHFRDRDTALSEYLKEARIKTAYKDLEGRLKLYRNYYVHQPGVALLGRGGHVLVLRRKHVKLSSRWSVMTRHCNDQEYFVDAKQLVAEDLKSVAAMFERIFSSVVIPEYEKAKTAEGFARIFRGYS